MLAAGKASSWVCVYVQDTESLEEFREGFMEEVTFQLTLKGEVGVTWVLGSRGRSKQGSCPA